MHKFGASIVKNFEIMSFEMYCNQNYDKPVLLSLEATVRSKELRARLSANSRTIQSGTTDQ